jgi:hypothetical protein
MRSLIEASEAWCAKVAGVSPRTLLFQLSFLPTDIETGFSFSDTVAFLASGVFHVPLTCRGCLGRQRAVE